MATTNRAPLNSTASLPKYMARRGSILYFKRRIPADVAEGFPSCSGQIWLSLGTHLVEKAKVLLAVEVTEFNLRVASLRRERALSFATAELAESPASQAHASSPLRATEKRLSRLASPSASLELLPARAATSLRPKQVPAKVKAAVPPKVIASARCASIDRPSMLHLFEDWKRKQDRPRTVGAVHTAVMEFRTLHGALPMEEITKAHARAYRDHLIERQLSKGTVENRLGFLATLVRHGMKEMVEHLTLNAFERIEVVGAQGLRKPKQRRAYEVHELNTLFASRLYTAGYRPDGQCVDVAYWAPLLGTFTGARIEELCQLRIDDVQCINGVWCIRICNLDEEQNIKTDSSFRRIPLHKVVVNSGFLVYAARMAKAGVSDFLCKRFGLQWTETRSPN